MLNRALLIPGCLSLVLFGCIDLPAESDEPAAIEVVDDVTGLWPASIDRLPGDRADDPLPPGTPPGPPVWLPRPAMYWTFDAIDRTGERAADIRGARDLDLPAHSGEHGRIHTRWAHAERARISPDPTLFAGDFTVLWWGAARTGGPTSRWNILGVGDDDQTFELGFLGAGARAIYLGQDRRYLEHEVPEGNHLYAVTRRAEGERYSLYIDGVLWAEGTLPRNAEARRVFDSATIGIAGDMDDLAVFDAALDDAQHFELWLRADIPAHSPRAIDHRPFDVRDADGVDQE